MVVSVSDTGGGIPEDIITNIFNPFFTTKHTGTGLGLAITHRVVEMHGGSIQVKNVAGVGATFILSFPAKGGKGKVLSEATISGAGPAAPES